MDMGKKAVASRAMRGFGKNLTAEVRLTKDVLEEIFHTTAADWMSLYRAVQEYWSITGTHGHQCMFANGLAALFIACGQDVGYLPEASYGYLLPYELPDGGLHVTVQIPCLVVGTVGGGCGLPTQRECLRILGCDGPGGARKFAEIAPALCSRVNCPCWAPALRRSSSVPTRRWGGSLPHEGRHKMRESDQITVREIYHRAGRWFPNHEAAVDETTR